MKLKHTLLTLLVILVFMGCQKNETITPEQKTNETLLSEIADFEYDNEALRYYANMGDFIDFTTSDITSESALQLKSASNAAEVSNVNPIFEEFLNLDIEDEDGNLISFFDLSKSERSDFIQLWIKANAYDLTPKLNDPSFKGKLKKYIKVQNDAFDEAMKEFIDTYGCQDLKSALTNNSSDEVYYYISNKVQEQIKAYCKKEIEEKNASFTESKNLLKSTDHSDYVNPSSVLTQLQEHAERGNVLISLPDIAYSSDYFYSGPIGVTYTLGLNVKYPPGHTSIVVVSGDEIQKTSNDISISSQNYDDSNGYSINGVQYEQIYGEWNCQAYLCYVKKTCI